MREDEYIQPDNSFEEVNVDTAVEDFPPQTFIETAEAEI